MSKKIPTKETILEQIEKNRSVRMKEEVNISLGDNHTELLRCLYETFQSSLGIGRGYFVKPCFNKTIVENVSEILRQKGIQSIIAIDEETLMRATCCSYSHGCSKCRAFCCLYRLWNLTEGENALLNEPLCEEVCRCVQGGAGIFGLSLLFALLRTSPKFREDSLILFALTNFIKEDTWEKAADIAKMFFKSARELDLHFLFFEPSGSAETREKRFEEIRIMEIELCKTVYANKIAEIEEEEAAAEAAALEEKKRGMPRCQICFGDPMDSPPICFPITCNHKICCDKCFDSKDSGEKLDYICPICQKPFTGKDIWYM